MRGEDLVRMGKFGKVEALRRGRKNTEYARTADNRHFDMSSGLESVTIRDRWLVKATKQMEKNLLLVGVL